MTLSTYKFVEIRRAGAAGGTGRKMVALTHRGAGTWNLQRKPGEPKSRSPLSDQEALEGPQTGDA